jgi:hypothetical protein
MRYLVGLVFVFVLGAMGCSQTGGDFDPGWGDPQNIANGYDPALAANANGTGMAVWLYFNGTDVEVWAGFFTPESGWQTPELVAAKEDFARYPQVAMDPSGNAVAVWHQDRRDQRYNAWAANYTPSGGWETPELLDPDFSGNTETPSVAIDASGNAIAAWVRFTGTGSTIVAARYTPTGGWSTVVRLDDDKVGYPSAPQVAMDPDGNAIAIWRGDDGERGNIFANRLAVQGGWGDPENIDNRTPGFADGNQLAVDVNGNAIAVWRQEEEEQAGTRFRIWSNRFTPSEGWKAEPSRIESDDSPADSRGPAVSVNAKGEAVVVWQRWEDQTAQGAIWSNHYDPDSGWGTAVLVESDYIANYDADPDVAIDPNGNALAVWGGVFNYRGTIWSSRYMPNSGWDRSVRLDIGGDVAHPKVGMDASGKGLAVWPPLTGGLGARLWASRYGDGAWTDHTEVWQALCDGACGRALACFPEDVNLTECVFECMAERERMPCQPNPDALDSCVEDIEDWDCGLIAGGELPYPCEAVCAGPEYTM